MGDPVVDKQPYTHYTYTGIHTSTHVLLFIGQTHISLNIYYTSPLCAQMLLHARILIRRAYMWNNQQLIIMIIPCLPFFFI